MNKKMVIISTIILTIDQIIKSIVQINDIHVDIIRNFFSFNYYQNTGAAWSIMEGNTIVLIAISIVMLFLIYNMTFSYEETKFNNLSFGLLFGGIFGNLIDRVFYGFVRDFIDIKIFGYDFPVFNIADMAIVIGVVLLLISTLKGELKNGNNSRRKFRKNR